MTRFVRRELPGLAAALAATGSPLGSTFGARAQPAGVGVTFPDRPVRYIVPFTPAGLTDIMARLMAQKLSEAWPRGVVVENRPGGNGLIGADAAAKAPPDGHTLLAITLTHAVNVSLSPNAPYDLKRDFAPVAMLGSLPLVVVVNPGNPARTLADLLEQARTRPLNGGSSGNGSPPHLGLELLRRAAGAGPNLVHVTYRGGAPGVTDLVAGNLDFMVSNLPECIGQLRAGRLRGLAITDSRRHKLVPDLPTVHEAGAPGLEITNWTAMLVHAAVPAPTFQAIERATLAAVRDTELVRRAEDGGFDMLGWDSGRSRAYIHEQVDRWAKLVSDANIRAD